LNSCLDFGVNKASLLFDCLITYMNAVMSLLVGLSPLFFVLSLPTFAAAVWFGARGWKHRTRFRGAYAGSLVVGGLGFLFDGIAVAFAALDHPHRRLLDSVDSGPLTGVPTVFVIFLSAYTVAVVAGVVGGLCSYRAVRNGQPSLTH